MNFDNFQIQKSIPQTIKAQKVDEGKTIFLSSFIFPVQSYGP